MAEKELFGNSEQLDDNISRQEALRIFEEHCYPVRYDHNSIDKGMTLPGIVEVLNMTSPTQRWVLATPETMPDSFETVYVTVSIEKRRYVTRGVVANGKWVGIFGGGRVVAWMPITYPKPYNGELDG